MWRADFDHSVLQCFRSHYVRSLAGLVRFEYDNRSAQEMKARTILLFSLARELKLLADIFKLAIVVVNQVCIY